MFFETLKNLSFEFRLIMKYFIFNAIFVVIYIISYLLIKLGKKLKNLSSLKSL